MPIGDVYRVRVLCYATVLQQIAINNLYYLVVNETGSGASYANITNGFDSLMAPLYKPLISGVAHYRGVSVQKIAPGTPLVPRTSVTRDGAGTGGPTLLPAQDSYVLAIKTANAGRHFQGRIYPPFPPIASDDGNGQLAAPFFPTLQALGDALVTPLDVATPGITTLSLCVRSRTPQPGGLPPLISYTIATNAIARPRYGTQRRRGQYGRLNPLPF